MTLRAVRERVELGAAVKLFGRIRPAARGERVAIVDGNGRVLARALTAAGGRYSLRLEPRRRIRLRARWDGKTSDPVTVRVRPFVRTRLTRVRLFGRARVRGVVRPGHDAKRISVRLYRNGDGIRTKKVALRGRRFTARFKVRRPGSYRARATFNDSDHLSASDDSARRRTRLPRLRRGSRGPYVKLLERRLRRLNYHIRGVDRRYDFRTVDAVRAFNKVQRRARVGRVAGSTWRALASPRRPRARSGKPRFHVEIDQSKQVLYTVRKGRITNILHTSTGGGGAITRDGVWRVHRRIAGYSPGRLFYPSYFDGLRAIHGWPEVPTSAASHGCARVPMWAAKWIFRKIGLGTEIRIYH